MRNSKEGKDKRKRHKIQTSIKDFFQKDGKRKGYTEVILVEPVVKWAGGKRGLIDKYRRFFVKSFGKYYEPFFGGGAVFFYLFSSGRITSAKISDINPELINMYIVIRNSVDKLIAELKTGKYVNEKEVYYEIRAWEPSDPVQRAARLIYLNHTCYNGLYRVNKQGKFNVPYGKYPKGAKIFNERNLIQVSKCLKNVEITVEDFEESVNNAQEGDFIYFDPPYAPISETADFTSYTSGGFTPKDQERLAKLFKKLNDKGCYVMESNSNAPIILDLYKEFNIEFINAKRYINSDPKGRKGVQETLIMNYTI